MNVREADITKSSARAVGDAPGVSVVIPAYNVAAYIGETLDSVFAQTLPPCEVIVVNDGSADTRELEEVLRPYRERITYISQENQGPSAARNTAILRARGEYVALLDSDDLWLPEFLEAQVKELRQNPSLDLIYADALLFGDSILSGQTFMQGAPSRGAVTFDSLLRFECCIITSGVVARKQALVEAGLFDKQFIRCEDFDLWLRLAHRGGKLTYQRRVLGRHRLHAKSLASSSVLMLESQIEVLRKLRRTLPLSPGESKSIERQLVNCEAQVNLESGRSYFISGQYGRAAAAVARANDFYQNPKLKLVILALQVAPGLLHRIYQIRHRILSRNIAAANR